MNQSINELITFNGLIIWLINFLNNNNSNSDGTVNAEKLGTAAVKIDVLEDHNVNQTILLNVQVWEVSWIA